MMRKIAGLILSALAAAVAGCSSSECYDNHSALPLASFYSSVGNRPVNIQGLEIYGIDAPNDSILYTAQSLGQAYLPFRLWQDSTQYVFVYTTLAGPGMEDAPAKDLPSDTVTFRYHPQEWFVSPACGAMYFYDMKNVSHSSLLIDSISCDEVITNKNAANIRIFFKEEIDD